MQSVRGTGKRIKGQGSKWIRPEKRQAIYRRDGNHCLYCNCSVAQHGAPAAGAATLDHLHPIELGGSNHETNLVTCCLSCNSAKQDLKLSAFLRTLSRKGVDVGSVRIRIRRCTRRKLVKGA